MPLLALLLTLALQECEVYPRFGRSVCALDDLDGDGVPEFAVGASRASSVDLRECGSVLIYSGKELEVLLRIDGAEPELRFGMSLSTTEDIDGDGLRDIFVDCASGRRVAAVSSATGRKLWTHRREGHPWPHAYGLPSLVDVDGDGRRDHLIFDKGAGGGIVRTALSAVTGKEMVLDRRLAYHDAEIDLRAATLHSANDEWWVSLRPLVPDVSFDWRPRRLGDCFVIGTALIDGKTGSVLHTWSSGSLPNARRDFLGAFGDTVLLPGDLNADGHDDVVIGAPGAFDCGVFAFSGAEPERILWTVGEGAWERWGTALAALPDRDGDGRAEILVGGTDVYPASQVSPGRIWILSGRTGEILWSLGADEVAGL